MNKGNAQRGWLFVLIVVLMIVACGCTKSPKQVREWYKDSRAPVKMQEFIHNSRFSLDSKVEALMVLVEHQYINEIPLALGDPIKNDEMNRIVAKAITRMDELMEVRSACRQAEKTREDAIAAGAKPESIEEVKCPVNDEIDTRIKDAAYMMLKLELNDENRDCMLGYIRVWLEDEDHFYRPLNRAGRIEQRRLFEELGTDALPIFNKNIRFKLDQLYASLEEEAKLVAEAEAAGKKIKRMVRPSDAYTNTLADTLNTIRDMKIPGADDMVADLFLEDINKTYPNMPRVLALPFSMNESEKLAPVAQRIVTDPEYKNTTLNYFKNVILLTYYPKVAKKAGLSVCRDLIQSDRTGYTRWDCMDLLTADAGRDGLATLIQTLPNDYTALAIPADHPQLLEHRSMTFWNSVLVYCTRVPSDLNSPVPLDVYRQLAAKGNAISKIVSMACLSTNGTADDVTYLQSLSTDRMSLKNWGMSITTFGDLAKYTSKTLESRLNAAAAKAAKENEKAAGEAAQAAAGGDAAKAAGEAEQAAAGADAAKAADAAAATK